VIILQIFKKILQNPLLILFLMRTHCPSSVRVEIQIVVHYLFVSLVDYSTCKVFALVDRYEDVLGLEDITARCFILLQIIPYISVDIFVGACIIVVMEEVQVENKS
jgi:hypothetical protein